MSPDDRAARLADLMDHGPYPRAGDNSAPAPGTEVSLRLFTEPGHVRGWFACRFVDDDPDCGRGVTDRILGSDGQCWEGQLARPERWTR